MRTYTINIQGHEIKAYEYGGKLYFIADVDDEAVKNFINEYTYGVKVRRNGNKLYFIPTEHSGIKPEHRSEVKQYLINSGFSDEEAEYIAKHNQIMLVALAVVAALGIGAVMYYRQQIGDLIWKVILPVAIIGGSLYIGYRIMRR